MTIEEYCRIDAEISWHLQQKFLWLAVCIALDIKCKFE